MWQAAEHTTMSNYQAPSRPSLGEWEVARLALEVAMEEAGIDLLSPSLEAKIVRHHGSFKATITTNMNRALDEFHPAQAFLKLEATEEAGSCEQAIVLALRAFTRRL